MLAQIVHEGLEVEWLQKDKCVRVFERLGPNITSDNHHGQVGPASTSVSHESPTVVRTIQIEVDDEDIGMMVLHVYHGPTKTLLHHHAASLTLLGRAEGPHKLAIIVNDENSTLPHGDS